MSNSSSKGPETIRLMSRVRGNLSLHLNVLRWPSAGSLRRATALTPISIAQGSYYDICAQLRCSLDEALAIVERSPEVLAFQRSLYLDVLPWPQPEEVHAAPSPAPVVTAIDPVAETHVAAAPLAQPEVTAASTPPAAELPSVTAPPEPPAAVPSLFSWTTPTAEPVALTGGAEPAQPAEQGDGQTANGEGQAPAGNGQGDGVREPSMDWTEDSLRTYAARRGIDVSKAKSKTAVLRTLRSMDQR